MTISGLTAKLLSKKGKTAEIEIDNQTIAVSREFIPEDVKDGENLQLYFSSLSSAKMKDKELAQAILDQILNGGK